MIMPKAKRARQTAPIEVMEAQTFYPTMAEFSDFKKYMEKIEKLDAWKAGIFKIVPPKEWTPRKAGYEPESFPFTIDLPLKQNFMNHGESGAFPPGVFQAKGSRNKKISIPDYYKMATNTTYRTPAHENEEELEKKYWKSLNFIDPVYGCDVTEGITDDGVPFNVGKLDSILNLIQDETGQVVAVSHHQYKFQAFL